MATTPEAAVGRAILGFFAVLAVVAGIAGQPRPAFAAAASASAPASAPASNWDRTETTEVRLISAQRALGPSGEATLGLQIRLAEHWKVYWRSPGDAGYPPSIDWRGSENLESAEMAWPAPDRFIQFGDLVTNGYADEVVFPLAIKARDPDRPLRLHAVVDYAACAEICVPMTATLDLALPAGAAAPTVFAPLIARFQARVPGPAGAHGLAIESVEVAGAGADRILRVRARAEPPFATPLLFVEGGEARAFGASEAELLDGGAGAILRVPAPEGRKPEPLVGVPLTLTLVDGERAIEQRLTAVAGAAEGPRLAALATMLALALLGGLILNVMPCVLPVLSLKLMGVVSQGGVARRRIVLRFLATAAGILVSFLALAGLAIGLKAAGLAAGWGIQFQEPAFLIALVIVLTLFACNLWGWFEIPLPAALASRAARSGGDGLVGHFASGAFATLLATPCSAPFLGTAVSFALARGPGEIVAIFAALGIGMATPFLAVAAFPGLARRLPRPGPWMETLRRVLGVLLAGTAVWLVTVLGAQAGARTALAVGIIMVAAAALLWAGRTRLPRGALAAGLAALAVLAFAAPSLVARETALAAEGGGDGGAGAEAAFWRPFEPEAIPALVASGKTVFVDVTAEWCLTCKFNEATVLSRAAVLERLKDANVVAMRADWTGPDDRIAAYLEGFDRFGIPFNAVYGPAVPRGLALPELLTEDLVIQAFARAGTRFAEAH